MINCEVVQVVFGQLVYIMVKVNLLIDLKVICVLYKVSQVGVRIDLVVCGMCCLWLGILGVLYNIYVCLIIGCFFEYSCIYYFFNGGDEKFYLFSVDWMECNFDMCVEICFLVEGKKLVQWVKKELEMYLIDNIQVWVLQVDGSYQWFSFIGNQNFCNIQVILLEKLVVLVFIVC